MHRRLATTTAGDIPISAGLLPHTNNMIGLDYVWLEHAPGIPFYGNYQVLCLIFTL